MPPWLRLIYLVAGIFGALSACIMITTATDGGWLTGVSAVICLVLSAADQEGDEDHE